MTTRARTYHLRGFTLLEVVLVLSLIGVFAVAVVPLLGSSAPLSADLQARTTVSLAADATATVWQASGTTPAPPCDTAVPATQGAPHNGPMFADPCTLGATEPSITWAGATTPSTAPNIASVAATESATGWTVAVAAAATGDAGTLTTCQAIVRDLPGAVERFLTFPVPAAGCSAGTALAADDQARSANACTGQGQSWRRVCTLAQEE